MWVKSMTLCLNMFYEKLNFTKNMNITLPRY
jgi:hypothetical protein